ncbi:acetate kinase [Kineosphaera limosa NBRC 100340]|uniref:Acetate kinase n=1 Tax=Kineosphaera limosa NBRC 100340 TaxID=1184609 RepID=K6WRL0_9MICO|nr:acetate kinase [Kineosphaera limosa NBRC 100340]
MKFAVVDPQNGARLVTGLAERVGTREASASVRFVGTDGQFGQAAALELGDDTGHRGVLAVALAAVQEWAREHAVELVATGHRVVHGGEAFSASVVLDEEAMDAVRECIPLAPLHNPANIAGVEAARAVLPDVPHVAVFDTAFHQTMPAQAYRYAVPAEWARDYGVRRYGFHGTSHRYVSARAARELGRYGDPGLRLVTAHLGNGCSLAAVKGGRSLDTSMGLTPLEGLVMGTRSGDLDPGVLGYIHDRTGADISAITADLNKRSGLLGLSGISNDMRTLDEAAEAGDERAQLAIEVFTYRLAKYIAALMVPLQGLDALVFTGGIGENSTTVRSATLGHLRYLGLEVDPAANQRCIRGEGGIITRDPDSTRAPVAIVVPTDEELVIARDAAALTR